jgi:hypothetical protein
MPWYFWAGPVLMAKGMFSKVPIIAGSVREDIGDVYTSIVPPIIAAPPIGKPCEPATCTVANFISWGRSLGFNATEVAALVAAYSGPPENGRPSSPAEATDWYWASGGPFYPYII